MEAAVDKRLGVPPFRRPATLEEPVENPARFNVREPLAGEELLKRQVQKRSSVLSTRQQQACFGDQLVAIFSDAAHVRLGPRAPFLIRAQHAIDVLVGDLGQRCLSTATSQPVTGVHAVGDHGEATAHELKTRPIGDAVVKDSVHHAVVQLVLVFRQTLAVAKDDAHGGEQQGVRGQRRQPRLVADLTEHLTGRGVGVGGAVAQNPKPTPHQQQLQRLRERLNRRVRKTEPADVGFRETVRTARHEHSIAAAGPPVNGFGERLQQHRPVPWRNLVDPIEQQQGGPLIEMRGDDVGTYAGQAFRIEPTDETRLELCARQRGRPRRIRERAPELAQVDEEGQPVQEC